MIPETVGVKYDIGRIASVRCVGSDPLTDLRIKGKCFLLLIVYSGTGCFRVGERCVEVQGPCFVCFDETADPALLRQHKLVCDGVYFHPCFLNVNMSFRKLRSQEFQQLAAVHDMFLLKPFTDPERFVFPLFEGGVERIKNLWAQMDDQLQRQRDWYWSCRSRSYFMELLLILERVYQISLEGLETDAPRPIGNPNLKKAVFYIESSYQNHVKLEDIVAAASLNHTSLTRLFREELQTTPMEYLWRHRLAVARKHLEFTDLPVKDIALRCGFKTLPHFSRKFEEHTGLTPSTFRAQALARRKAAF